MFVEKIKYTDLFGTEREETFYFNLSKAELLEMDFAGHGHLEEALREMVDKKDSKILMKTFKEILLKSYGERSADGRRFMKDGGKLAEAFAETPAYDILFNRLVSDAEYSAKFINGVLPEVEGGAPSDKPVISVTK